MAHPKAKAAWTGEGTGWAVAITLAWLVNDVLGYTLELQVAMAMGFLVVGLSRWVAKLLIMKIGGNPK
jgi:hypothetical protein